MTVTLNLSPATERRLQELAARNGQTLEQYLEQLVERSAGGANGTPTVGAELSDEEFDRLLDELSAGGPLPHLPADFSRADIYADHD